MGKRKPSFQARFEGDPSNLTNPNIPPFTGTGPTISNVVAGMDVNCLIDLKTVAMHCRNSLYNPKRFPAVIMRIREPKATGLIFAKGKLQVLGCRSVEDARLAGRKFARILQKTGFAGVKLTDFAVQNMVGNADTKMLIRLEGLQRKCALYAKYEPELFPGMVFSLAEPKMVMLIFAKGKLVFLGAKKEEDMREALGKVWPLLLQFRMSEGE